MKMRLLTEHPASFVWIGCLVLPAMFMSSVITMVLFFVLTETLEGFSGLQVALGVFWILQPIVIATPPVSAHSLGHSRINIFYSFLVGAALWGLLVWMYYLFGV